jgi:hypothetical protein
MTARDILYGRRGGGWADGPARELTPEAQAAADRLRREHAQHPLSPVGLVPGTGQDWHGRARTAAARLTAYGPDSLDELDVEALIRSGVDLDAAATLHVVVPDDLAGALGPDNVVKLGPTATVTLDTAAYAAELDRRMEEARRNRRAGELRRDDGMARAEEHAPDDWKDAAKAALRRLAADREYLTGDDLWTLVPKPAEPRASGPLFRWAANEGLIAPTDRFVPTTQATSHASPSRVWRSLTYRGGPADG